MTQLKSVRVRNFQSIEDISTDFAKFTVLVGPSSSGKSAFLRGIKTCLRNSFVPSNVRSGTTKSIVDVQFTDGIDVSIERGKSLSTYRLGSQAEAFTKSARTIPDDVAKALKVPLISDVDLTFSFQFDKPFLVSESGFTAAQVIGSLTNVSLLHAAIRETNRRVQESSSLLKVRQSDLVSLTDTLQSFRDLPEMKTRLEQAQLRFDAVRPLESRMAALKSSLEAVRNAETALARLKPVQVPQVSIKSLDDQSKRLSRLTNLISVLDSTQSVISQKSNAVFKLEEEILSLENAYNYRLEALGTCPLCGQEVTHAGH